MNIKTVRREGYSISYINEEEFELIYKDIFKLKEYKYSTQNNNPFIIDCGSHIGLSILYFKKLYPYAKIIAFEPNPMTFTLLEKNINQNNIENVTLINAAVAEEKREIDFYISTDEEIPWTWGDSAAKNKWATDETTKIIRVPSVKLSEYIVEEVDLLKLDVEGLEEVVLRELNEKLTDIDEIFMEFHGSSTNQTNDSGRILQFLKNKGFSYTITQESKLIDEQDIRKNDPYWLIIHADK